MESSILKQIGRFLQEQKKEKRWLVVFMCLAIIVGIGTVTALKLRGQAMTHKEKVVICQLDVHQHTDGCYDEAKENLICGYADYVVHLHNDDCYDWNGNLTCTLPEIEKHEHTEECYTEEKTLICGQEEVAGHQHSAECYSTEQGGLLCQVPEHQHDESCCDETGAVICELEEHTHEDSCYEWTDVLTCQLPEGADGHTHTDECYEINTVLSCGKLELHTHTDECYEKINEEEELSETNRRLVCTIPVLEEHIHTEEAGCFEIVEVTVNGETIEEETEETGDVNEQEQEIFTTDLDDEETESEEADKADAKEDETEQKTYDESKIYEGDGYVVTVSYNKDANIPEEADLIAEQITEESDAEKYKEHEAQAQEMMDDEETGENVLFKIGFYIEEDGKKKEIEPETPVAVTIQFLDEDGTLEGSPITVIHFAEEGNEVLDGSDIEDGSTTFEMDSFSYVMLKIRSSEQEADTKKVSVHISKDATYEDDVFSAAFHLDGEIRVSEEIAKEIESEENGEGNSEETLPSEEGTEEGNPTEEGMEEENSTEEESEEGSSSEEGTEEESSEDEGSVVENPEEETEEGSEGSASEDSDTTTDNGKLKFEVKPLDTDSEEYQAAVEKIKNFEEEDQILRFEMMSYSLTYDGEEIDLAGCKVIAEISTAESLVDKVNEMSVPETIKEVMAAKAPVTEVDDELVENGTGIMIGALDAKPSSVEKLGDAYLNPGAVVEPIECEYGSTQGNAAMYATSRIDVLCTVQYYAYAQTWAKIKPSNGDAINVINTSSEEDVYGKAVLPNNWTTPRTKSLYVKSAGQSSLAAWPQYEPAYEEITSISSLTQLYASSKVNSSVIVSNDGVDGINKFAKDGLNFDLYELWILKEGKKADSINKEDWDVYTKDQIKDVIFTNLESSAGGKVVLIKDDTVIRLVGMRNEKTKDYPADFFDYDFTDGSSENPTHVLKGINDPSNYTVDEQGKVITPRYGFGNNSSGATGLKDDQIVQNGKSYNINIARTPASTIIEKCSFGLVESSLEGGYPKINVNAPNLFDPNVTQKGKTNISGYSLNFLRSGDTYTLNSVNGAGNCASELNKFQKRPETAYGTNDTIWTNQFWPMDAASTFGDTANNHDLKFGTQEVYDNTKLAVSDDGNLHNSFFGMSFGVEFTLTEDYVGPLNYYFFGDDDMWVFLEYPDRTTKLVCDIGGVHQAAGEYVNLWNYIQRPNPDGTNTVVNTGTDTDEEDRGLTYKLKFFYTERGASGSTCWMQFTLPSVNMVPVDTTGNAKSTLTLRKTVDGDLTDEIKNTAFEFVFTLKNQTTQNEYPYSIKDEKGNDEKTGWIKSGDTFKLKHNQSFYVYRLPNGAEYEITENVNTSEYHPILGAGTQKDVIISGETVGGEIDYNRDDNVNLINQQLYTLPETGGVGPIIYTMAGVLTILAGAGFMYRKKVRERRV